MNVIRGSGAVAAGLAPMLAASQAEGFRFATRLVAEIADGHFDAPGAALFGAYDFGAYDDSAGLLGVVGLNRDPYVAEPCGREIGRVRHLHVLPAHRSAGVGRALIAGLVEEVRLHYRVLRLRTDTPAAAAFYRALGFSDHPQSHITHVLKLLP